MGQMEHMMRFCEICVFCKKRWFHEKEFANDRVFIHKECLKQYLSEKKSQKGKLIWIAE